MLVQFNTLKTIPQYSNTVAQNDINQSGWCLSIVQLIEQHTYIANIVSISIQHLLR